MAEAVSALKKALSIDPYYAGAHSNLGNIYLKQGLAGEAIKYYIKVGDQLIKTGKKDEAVEFYNSIKTHLPDNIFTRNQLAQAYQRQGLSEIAIEEADIILFVVDAKVLPTDTDNEIAKILREGFEVIRVPSVRKISNVYHLPSFNGVFYIIKFLKNERPDIVHCQPLGSLLSLIFLLFKSTFGYKIVGSVATQLNVIFTPWGFKKKILFSQNILLK